MEQTRKRAHRRDGLRHFSLEMDHVSFERTAVDYTVRYGDTLETIAFDWKISPQEIVNANRISSDLQLVPGQSIILPALAGS